MAVRRKAFQGTWNILRFNWHFYLLIGLISFTLFALQHRLPDGYRIYATWLLLFLAAPPILSVLVSLYVYDLSGLYQLRWLPKSSPKKVLNVHAGFDETSELIQEKYSDAEMTTCDFYDPVKHTEVSLQRARKAYPPSKENLQVSAVALPFQDGTFDCVLAIFSAHEIRDTDERIAFFEELKRVTQSGGRIYVTEHLRDFNNFCAYTVGFFHFHSRSSWKSTFRAAKLRVRKEIKVNPFVTTFELE